MPGLPVRAPLLEGRRRRPRPPEFPLVGSTVAGAVWWDHSAASPSLDVPDALAPQCEMAPSLPA